MKKALNALTNVEKGIVILTFSLMVICSFLQVINRNFFKLPIGWFDEASTYCMIYMALIGTELGLRDGTKIAVTAVVDKLKGVPGPSSGASPRPWCSCSPEVFCITRLNWCLARRPRDRLLPHCTSR